MRHLLLFLISVNALLFAEDELFKGLGLNSEASKEAEQYTCEHLPTPAPPAQHSGAEGLPPLPLPAVPLRRTEKKNPPKPPVLVWKLASGKESNWNTNPADIDNLLKWMAKEMNVHYSFQVIVIDTECKDNVNQNAN